MRPLLILALLLPFPATASAHPGRTAADGCHHDRKNGGRHCHGGRADTSAPQPLVRRPKTGSAYTNCAAARAAGAAPVLIGQPGYGPHLDRDGDGVGCEPYRGRR
ncbi:excalibur calcium-binding domain-containing protein [Sphingosinicella rhizophila]|uniref:Excalibur calcium-binding domain-containing protein n=1 Tax=Sphingosinicella rhizophila TaxID=3050082 RepID=A0ABU3Q5R5_9SPHN|nr:excalibur calcium-binding domain-containing protein [Sphingosinicella sp. GR2756]MDT9598647.1 excalibur calcium-binding domain-containing protein [Sphingosinicella sp. GR2756]